MQATIRRDDEHRLFSTTIMVAACILALQYLMSASQQQQFTLIALFTSLSGIYVSLEDRLNLISADGYNIVSVGRGRPRIGVDLTQVGALFELRTPLSDIATIIGISRVTLWRRLSQAGVRLTRFTDITDDMLDNIISTITRNSSNIGISMVMGHLRASAIHVSRKRIWDSLVRLS